MHNGLFAVFNNPDEEVEPQNIPEEIIEETDAYETSFIPDPEEDVSDICLSDDDNLEYDPVDGRPLAISLQMKPGGLHLLEPELDGSPLIK